MLGIEVGGRDRDRRVVERFGLAVAADFAVERR